MASLCMTNVPVARVVTCSAASQRPVRVAARPGMASSMTSSRFIGLPVKMKTMSTKLSTRQVVVRADASPDKTEDKPIQYNTEFGYSRKDVIFIGVGITSFGYAAYYGLQATGMEPGMAGNFIQAFVVFAMTIGWVGSYLWRVKTKDMTYAKQLRSYEDAVMLKRLEEMPETEREKLIAEEETK